MCINILIRLSLSKNINFLNLFSSIFFKNIIKKFDSEKYRMNIHKRDDEDYFAHSRFVKELKPSDFDDIEVANLKEGSMSDKCVAILFYAPWCPYCKMLKNVWDELGKKASFFKVCAFNCEKHREHCEKIKTQYKPMINGYPTMFIYKDGRPLEKIGTDDQTRNIQQFIKDCARVCGS